MRRPLQTPEQKRAKSAWRVMKRRCLEQTFQDFPRYGGAGITICPQWIVSFQEFLTDIGLPPSPDHWLGRWDVTGHYTPDNCHWTLPTPQKNRRAYCQHVVVSGQTMTAAQAGRLPDQPTRDSVLRRWQAGFKLESPPAAKLYKKSIWITHNGQTLPTPVWAHLLGIPSSVLWCRIKSGMPIERALTKNLS
jgi:hypothetical protein